MTDALVPALEDARDAHEAVVDRFRADATITPPGPYRQRLEGQVNDVQDSLRRIEHRVRKLRPRSGLVGENVDMARFVSRSAVRTAMLPLTIGSVITTEMLRGRWPNDERRLLRNAEDEYVVTARALAACRAGQSIAEKRLLTDQGVGRYLRRWGLTFQRPDKRAVEQDAEAVRLWREETWPAIRARAKAEGGEVLFADQVGIRSDQVAGRTWGAKGCTPVVRRTGNRFSVNAMSAISTKGRMHFMVFTETFDADVMCRFLNRLAGHFDRKVHLVVDAHSAHRSRKVRAWLADHPDASSCTSCRPTRRS
ncbi:IS630 family transposase [Streptomyces sp. NPDC002838]|uniref:IS630 family transposase n=1 Tax=Streptomyces sp. NPDC002838 TaxID=3154436 RepID=UPI00331FDD55